MLLIHWLYFLNKYMFPQYVETKSQKTLLELGWTTVENMSLVLRNVNILV